MLSVLVLWPGCGFQMGFKMKTTLAVGSLASVGVAIAANTQLSSQSKPTGWAVAAMSSFAVATTSGLIALLGNAERGRGWWDRTTWKVTTVVLAIIADVAAITALSSSLGQEDGGP